MQAYVWAFSPWVWRYSASKSKKKLLFPPPGVKASDVSNFYFRCMKSKVLAPLHRHEKQLKSWMCYKKYTMNWKKEYGYYYTKNTSKVDEAFQKVYETLSKSIETKQVNK